MPEYWIIPINSAAVGNPPALVANDQIASQQSFFETVFPLHDVNWVRKPWTEIGALPIGNQEAKNWLPDVNDALNDYYDDLMITHSEKLEETGVEPFNLPDQIYGFTARGGGLSDPAKYNGERRVSSGLFGTSGPLTMAHEINHNLDSVSPRTWGKHTTDADDDTDNNNWGCGAEGGNTDWPRMNDEIGEIGFDTRLPWQESGTVQLTVIPNNWPDLMSYCRSAPESNALPNQEPFKWTSEYRWEKHYLKFRPPSPFELGVVIPPELVYYVSGTLTAVDAGSLDPVRTLPGIPSTNITPGDWSLEVQNVGGSVLWATTFDVSFISEEGDELTEVRFRYRVPTQETAAKIVLKHLGSTIDTLEASANAPVINITTPSGGETWGDSANVVWTASDADDDDLSFTLFYSPDDGERWFPVARNLLGTEHEFATTGLPGGTQGKLRLVATDGFHTVIAVSMGYFTVSDAEPSVVIESPLAGKIYRPREWITMRGSASLPGNDGGGLSFAWFLDDELLDVGDQFSAQFDEGDYALMLVAWDEDGNFGTADISLLVFEDDPPNEPILPLPHDGTSGTVIDPTLSWLGGDPDGNAVTYDVLLDAGNPNPTTLVCDDALVSECLPAFPLVPETMYYWKVVARDDTGLETHGQIWSFTTGQYNSLEVIFGDGFE